MLSISRIKKVMTVLTLTLGVSGFAYDWSTPFSGPKGRINTLVITANYKPPLILAQLMMASNRQPYVQVPSSSEGKDSIFFFPAGKNEEGQAADGLQILEKDMARFIRFVNPKQVMVVGCDKYVSAKYIKMIDKKIPIIVIKGDDWQRMATSVGELFDIPTLSDDYARIYKNWKDSYLPTKKPVVIKEELETVTEIPAKEVLEDKDADNDLEKLPELKPVASKEAPKDSSVVVKVPADASSPKEPEAVAPKKAPVLVKDK